MTALTITHHIAAPLEVIPNELGLTAGNLVTAAKVLEVVDTATFEAGNNILIKAHATLKELEAARVKLKKPITELGKAIDQVVASVADPLELAKRTMQGRVSAFQRAEQAKADALRREAEERARIEREAAEKERQRLQAEADAKHAAEVAAAEAKAKADAEELAEVLGKPVEAAPVQVAPAPVVEAPKPAAPSPVIPAAPVSSAIQTRKVPVLVVKDAGALVAFLFANGMADLVSFDMPEIKRRRDAGVPLPGLEVEIREQTAMVGRRS